MIAELKSQLAGMLACLFIIAGLLIPTASYSQLDPDIELEWAEKEFALPFAFDPETDSDVVAKATKLQLTITDPELNNSTGSAETVALTPVEDSDDLTIYIEDTDGDVLIGGNDITDCSGFDSASFVESGKDTGEFSVTFDVAGNGCGLDPEDLADAKLVADYKGETESTTFRGYNAKIETTEKDIYAGLEITITVTDEDQNKDSETAEEVKIEIEPAGIDSTFFTLDETDEDTGKFSIELTIGDDFTIVDDGVLVHNVVVKYTDPATADGSDQERTLILAPEKVTAELEIEPSDKASPWTRIEVSLTDKDLNKDPDEKDVVDYPVLSIYTDNGDIADDEISLGEDGLRLEETDENTGIFELVIDLVMLDENDNSFDASLDELELPAEPGDRIVIVYEDTDHAEGDEDLIELIIDVESFDPEITTDKDEYLPDDVMEVTISDLDANVDPDVKDLVDFKVYTNKDRFGKEFSAVETAANSGNFTFDVGIVEEEESDAVTAELGDTLFIEYDDPLPADYDKHKVFTVQVPVGEPIPAAENTDAEAPVTKDFEGNEIDSVTKGKQVWLTTEVENNLEQDKGLVVMIEVRDKDGVTVYLEWQMATLGPNGKAEVALPWTPGSEGTYDVRTLVLSGLSYSAEVLSAVKQSQITVV